MQRLFKAAIATIDAMQAQLLGKDTLIDIQMRVIAAQRKRLADLLRAEKEI